MVELPYKTIPTEIERRTFGNVADPLWQLSVVALRRALRKSTSWQDELLEFYHQEIHAPIHNPALIKNKAAIYYHFGPSKYFLRLPSNLEELRFFKVWTWSYHGRETYERLLNEYSNPHLPAAFHPQRRSPAHPFRGD